MPFGVQTDWRREALPKPEIFSYPPAENVIDSVVVNATGVTADATGPYAGRRYLVQGTILTKRPDNQYERYTGSSAASEVQTITINGSPTGGTFTLTFNGQTTAPIAYNAANTAIDAALEALSNVGAGNVAVTGTGPFTVTFGGALANRDVGLTMTATSSLTGGTNPSVTVVTTTPGQHAQTIAGILGDTIEFADGSEKSDEPAAMWRRGVSFKALAIVDYATYSGALASALPSCEFV